MKTESKKKCDHSLSYYDSRLGYIKCTWCGSQVSEVKFSKVKGKPQSRNNQDPTILKAEKLKSVKASLEARIRSEKRKHVRAELESELSDILGKMLELQEQINNS